MPVTRPDISYSGVPTVESQGGGGTESGVRATPESFGAGVAGAVGEAGKEGFDFAMKQQGMINETLMTNADSQLAMKVGAIKGAYLQNTGLAAQAAFPQYQKDIEAARQEARAGLPPMAAHGFDMLSERSVANHIADGSTYAAGQVRQANIDSGTNLTNVNVQAVLDPNVAANPQRVQDHLDSAVAGIQMGLDDTHPGLKTDPETGTKSFDESTPQGQALKANYDAKVDNVITQVQTNRFDTLAKGDVLGAFGIYQQERDTFPKSTQVHLDSVFAPKVFNAHVDNGSTQVLADAEQQHAQLLYNPQSNADKTPLDVIRENEGNTGKIGKDSNGANVLNGINEKSFPKEYAEAKNLLDTQGKSAADAYTDNFYQKNIIDKYDIKSLPSATQAIVADGLVNHGAGDFGQSLIAAAKNGASPAQLVDMRRTEYQRLADSDTDGSKGYASSLKGWDARLDKFQTSPSAPAKSYGTNENGGPLTLADYYRTHSEDVLQRADAQAEKDMPGDLQYKRAMRETVSNYMSKTISNQSAQYTLDNKNIVRGITGEMSNGKAPETEADLRAIPGMGTLLDKVAAQDPKFAEGIPTMIAKNARRNDVTNSPNAFETITRTLQPQDELHPNHIKNQNQLDTLLGKTDSTGINMKDYNDAKPATELDSTIKEPLLMHMQQIANANGNLDGKGQQRAVQWYNQVMTAYKQNQVQGDKGMDIATFANNIGKTDGPTMPAPPTPSRMTQISNWAKEVTGLGYVLVTNPDGQQGYIPAGNVEKALAAGYKKVE